ncbi:MAG TPA: YciI family protein [Frankiaceae bacterium]
MTDVAAPAGPYFLYRLIPPRATFPADITADEAALMARHADYWAAALARGTVVVFGPVADPAGVWGLGVLEAPDLGAAQALVAADPAITSGLMTGELYPMLGGKARPAPAG